MQKPLNKRLKELASLFLKLGLLGFGGPAVHIAMMEEEVVRRRQWTSKDHFLDLIGATNLIPGPNSTELAMHIGQERAGWRGLVLAGCCFIVPAVVITACLAWLYQRYGQLPEVQPFIYGVKPAIIAVIVSLMIGLGKKALKTLELGILGAFALIAVLAGIHEIYVLFGLGLCAVLVQLLKGQPTTMNSLLPIALLQVQRIQTPRFGDTLFWIFLKVGAILYGSGYVLFSFLKAELVSKGLLTEQQLTDAIAVGQFTPGPVFSAATFIGWQIAGVGGAAAATIGIFLPSFLFVALLNPIVRRLRQSATMAAFLDAVNIVSVAIILATAVEIGRTAIYDWKTTLIALLSFIVTFRFKTINTAVVIFGAALLGYILYILF